MAPRVLSRCFLQHFIFGRLLLVVSERTKCFFRFCCFCILFRPFLPGDKRIWYTEYIVWRVLLALSSVFCSVSSLCASRKVLVHIICLCHRSRSTAVRASHVCNWSPLGFCTFVRRRVIFPEGVELVVTCPHHRPRPPPSPARRVSLLATTCVLAV